MFEILFLPFRLIGTILSAVFSFVGNIIGAVFGLVGGVFSLIFGGAFTILVIIGLVMIIRWFIRGVRGI